MINILKKFFAKKEEVSDESLEYFKPNFIPKECDLPIKERTVLALKGVTIGDIIGSKYEGEVLSEEQDPETIDLLGKGHTYTDDTIMSIATVEATEIACRLSWKEKTKIYTEIYRDFGNWYPDAGYGIHFKEWISNKKAGPYGSCGNGSAMRAGVIGAMFDDVGDVIIYAKLSAMPSHNHPEGIKGAIVTAVCTWMTFHGAMRQDIKDYLSRMYSKAEYSEYRITGQSNWSDLIHLNETMQTLSLICQTSVPEAFINLYFSTDYEDCMRNTMRYLCDRDTLGAISGGAAAGMYRKIEVEGKKADEIIEEYIPMELWKYFGLNKTDGGFLCEEKKE